VLLKTWSRFRRRRMRSPYWLLGDWLSVQDLALQRSARWELWSALQGPTLSGPRGGPDYGGRMCEGMR
jgi:hypothetical protein